MRSHRILPQINAIRACGMPVMGHIGLTPQTHAESGGFRLQGKTMSAALDLLEDAKALQAAGCAAIVLEMVPDRVRTEQIPFLIVQWLEPMRPYL